MPEPSTLLKFFSMFYIDGRPAYEFALYLSKRDVLDNYLTFMMGYFSHVILGYGWYLLTKISSGINKEKEVYI